VAKTEEHVYNSTGCMIINKSVADHFSIAVY